MRRYETIAIIDPDLSDEDRSSILDKLNDLILQQNGLLVRLDKWGAKKLAYEIKKRVRGYYVRWDYCGTGTLVDEMERFFRIDDRVLKYMTVLQEQEADIEEIKKEMAQAEAAAAQSAAAQSAQSGDSEAGQNRSDAPENQTPEGKPIQPETIEEE